MLLNFQLTSLRFWKKEQSLITHLSVTFMFNIALPYYLFDPWLKPHTLLPPPIEGANPSVRIFYPGIPRLLRAEREVNKISSKDMNLRPPRLLAPARTPKWE
ncbi:hypothetical protein EVAR_14574_1 [Eumeta japonica]|uniref:Uncharacterized protein n=1 Tax=Eumeta variegata TaxID=151549 RepID=A0A4C1UVL6_EUMVA|nr:hypothetical protein EVAR_14574_1 [Eumeta japonica]